MDETTAANLFKRWYVEPVEILKTLPDGNGGFAAFVVGIALYERLIKARLKLQHQPTDDDTVRREIAQDLRLPDGERSIFWDMFRNGMMHQAMPKSGKTDWAFHHSFSGYPEFKTINGQSVICINPWKFTDRVLQEFMSKPELIIASNSFPLGTIAPLPPELLV